LTPNARSDATVLKAKGVERMTRKKSLLALGFAIVLALSAAACDVEEDPTVPDGSLSNVESTF
jgi:hypothetical protein